MQACCQQMFAVTCGWFRHIQSTRLDEGGLRRRRAAQSIEQFQFIAAIDSGPETLTKQLQLLHSERLHGGNDREDGKFIRTGFGAKLELEIHALCIIRPERRVNTLSNAG